MKKIIFILKSKSVMKRSSKSKKKKYPLYRTERIQRFQTDKDYDNYIENLSRNKKINNIFTFDIVQEIEKSKDNLDSTIKYLTKLEKKIKGLKLSNEDKKKKEYINSKFKKLNNPDNYRPRYNSYNPFILTYSTQEITHTSNDGEDDEYTLVHLVPNYLTDMSIIENMNNQCVICLEYFKKHEKIISTKCGHIFHCKCAYKWFGGHTYCPICKCEI